MACGTAQVRRLGEKTREARLVYWEKDDKDGVARKEETGKAKKEVYGHVVKEDMAEVEVTEEDTEDRSNWRWKIRCGDP